MTFTFSHMTLFVTKRLRTVQYITWPRGKVLTNQTPQLFQSVVTIPYNYSMDFCWSLAQTFKSENPILRGKILNAFFHYSALHCSLNKSCCSCWMEDSSLGTERLENIVFRSPNQETDKNIQIESRTRRFFWAKNVSHFLQSQNWNIYKNQNDYI